MVAEGDALQPDWKFHITGAHDILNLEILQGSSGIVSIARSMRHRRPLSAGGVP